MLSVKVKRTCEKCGYTDQVMARQLTQYQLDRFRELGRAYVACPACGAYPMAAVMGRVWILKQKAEKFGTAPKLNAAWLFQKEGPKDEK